jgi:rhodanese-related sulfurtransferase/DNA-binding transcriptional ArsR family regulator
LRRRLYPEFARLGAALASDRRLELIDLLAQSPRNVDSLARETGMSVASVSQHLQVLHNSKLVEAQRAGNRTLYRLADDNVLRLWLTLRTVGERRLPEIDQILRLHFANGRSVPLSRDELQALLEEASVCIIDVRPRQEYEAGHLAGAISVPLSELLDRLEELPRDRRIITYCRGVYCEMSTDAEALLREEGFDVLRLEGGWPEWMDEGRPVHNP